MVKGLIAVKIGMSRAFSGNGEAIPVTYLKIEPNTVVRTKSKEKDGYDAIVLGVGPKRWKTRKGKEHVSFRQRREWHLDSLEGYSRGKEVSIEGVEPNARISITGTSKGKGFQGVIKRHKFSRGPMSHGSHHHREPGSVGMREKPGRIWKGKRMPGHMGHETVTLKKRSVVTVDREKGMIAVKGPVPGPCGGYVFVTIESDS